MYRVGDKLFITMGEATAYANFIHKVSRIILGIEKVQK